MWKIRKGKPEDEVYLVDWLSQPGVLKGFPIEGDDEIRDTARIWMSYWRIGAVLTALTPEDRPCGIANLYVQPYQKLAHQALFAILVDEAFRGRGVGTFLLTHLIGLAQDRFHIELLHLEVYQGNPAIRLYERMGFVEYGRHPHFIREKEGHYADKILMQKWLGKEDGRA